MMTNNAKAEHNVQNLQCCFRIPSKANGFDANEKRAWEYYAERAFDEALQGEALDSDEVVTVIRNVRCKLRLPLSQLRNPKSLGILWGKHLAKAVAQAVAKQRSKNPDIVQFSSQSAYLASYLATIVGNGTSDQWFFKDLQRRFSPSSKSLVFDLLTQHPAELPKILAELSKQDLLGRALARMSETQKTKLVEQFRNNNASETLSAEYLALARVAVQVVVKLDLANPESDYEVHLATRLHEVGSAADWNDAVGLARIVAQAVQLLAADYPLRPLEQHELTQERLLQLLVASLRPLNLDWLDLTVLCERIVHACRSSNMATIQESIPLSSPGLTPRQKQFLEDLGEALQELPSGERICAANQTDQQLKLVSIIQRELPNWVNERGSYQLAIEFLNAFHLVARSFRQESAELRTELSLDAVSAYLQELATRCSVGNDAENVSPRQAELQSAAEFLLRVQHEANHSHALFEHALHEVHPANSHSGSFEHNITLHRVVGHHAEEFDQEQTQSCETAQVFQHPLGTLIESSFAGTALLLRAMSDARFGSWLDTPQERRLLPLIMARTLGRLSQAFPNDTDEEIDPALMHLAGMDQMEERNSITKWSELDLAVSVSEDPVTRLQQGFFRQSLSQRWMDPSTIQLHRFRIRETSLLCASEPRGFIPFATSADCGSETRTVLQWIDHWQTECGLPQVQLVVDDELLSNLPLDLRGTSGVTQLRPVDESYQSNADAFSRLFSDRLKSADSLATEFTWLVLGHNLIRGWARWLKRFADSSTSYLLTQLIDRPGRVILGESSTTVALEKRPLDIILEMSGYLQPLELIPWLPGRRIEFQ